ncbi:hypothetical protein U14_01411 [Candidatus Moduliflexus flocculans]|uniref:Uncharacterized protein n=1 Tax=Candidatus Moduliflexus flocculans TaxID=1499966 RepID=A0A0S6VS00_9BACT|nr:hypothetical protein U14_01411 [Candidatus Moduliflexus flocculans]
MRNIGIALLLLICLGCGVEHSTIRIPQETCWETQDVSIIQLIANPAQFHQKSIRVIGFARIEFEGTQLYLSREFAEYRISENAIWLDVPLSDEFQQYDQQYVLLEGTFDKDAHGHMGLSAGTIKQISRIKIWPKIE